MARHPIPKSAVQEVIAYLKRNGVEIEPAFDGIGHILKTRFWANGKLCSVRAPRAVWSNKWGSGRRHYVRLRSIQKGPSDEVNILAINVNARLQNQACKKKLFVPIADLEEARYDSDQYLIPLEDAYGNQGCEKRFNWDKYAGRKGVVICFPKRKSD